MRLRPPSSAGASPKGRQPVSKTGGMGSSPMAPIGKPPWCNGNMRSRHGRDEGSSPSGGDRAQARSESCPRGSIGQSGWLLTSRVQVRVLARALDLERIGQSKRVRSATAARRSHEPEVAGSTPAVPITHRARGAEETPRSDMPENAGSIPAAPIRECPRGSADRLTGREPVDPGSSLGAGAQRARGSTGQSACLRSRLLGVRILPRPPFQLVARHRFFDGCLIKDK